MSLNNEYPETWYEYYKYHLDGNNLSYAYCNLIMHILVQVNIDKQPREANDTHTTKLSKYIFSRYYLYEK